MFIILDNKMAIVEKNTSLIQRKNFLMRAVYNKYKKPDEIKDELDKLNAQITINLQEALADIRANFKEEAVEIKRNVHTDGDMKRAVAKLIHNLLKDTFTNEEMKGIFRQGYKYMRANT